MSTDYVTKRADILQKLANAYVETMHWISTHTSEEIADKKPADYYKGVGKAAYVAALTGEKGIYSTDDLMPADGAQRAFGFQPDVKDHTIDLGKTYTNDFATKVSQTTQIEPAGPRVVDAEDPRSGE